MRSFKIVEIHWLDSMSSEGWKDVDSMDDCDMRHESIGYLINETDYAYIITSSFGYDSAMILAPLMIPKIAVTDIWIVTLL